MWKPSPIILRITIIIRALEQATPIKQSLGRLGGVMGPFGHIVCKSNTKPSWHSVQHLGVPWSVKYHVKLVENNVAMVGIFHCKYEEEINLRTPTSRPN